MLVTHVCPTLFDPMNCNSPGFSVHGILQAKTLEWVAIPFSRRSSQPRNRTQVSCIVGGFFTSWATREAQPDKRHLRKDVQLTSHLSVKDWIHPQRPWRQRCLLSSCPLTFTDNMTVHTGNTKFGYDKSLIITEFSGVTEKKDNIEKSTVFPYTSNEQLNTDI